MPQTEREPLSAVSLSETTCGDGVLREEEEITSGEAAFDFLYDHFVDVVTLKLKEMGVVIQGELPNREVFDPYKHIVAPPVRVSDDAKVSLAVGGMDPTISVIAVGEYVRSEELRVYEGGRTGVLLDMSEVYAVGDRPTMLSFSSIAAEPLGRERMEQHFLVYSNAYATRIEPIQLAKGTKAVLFKDGALRDDPRWEEEKVVAEEDKVVFTPVMQEAVRISRVMQAGTRGIVMVTDDTFEEGEASFSATVTNEGKVIKKVDTVAQTDLSTNGARPEETPYIEAVGATEVPTQAKEEEVGTQAGIMSTGSAVETVISPVSSVQVRNSREGFNRKSNNKRDLMTADEQTRVRELFAQLDVEKGKSKKKKRPRGQQS
jgi:hypothetical protein